jgi:hypothetical protein
MSRVRRGERGAALLLAVGLTAVLTVVAGTVGTLALIDARTGGAARAHVAAADAARAALGLALAGLADEPDLDAVRAGGVEAASNGAASIETAEGVVDVAGLTAALTREREGLPPPAGAAVWRPYLWGRLGELMPTPVGIPVDDALVVGWIRGDPGAGLGPDAVEVAAAAVRADTTQVRIIALAWRRAGRLGLESAWVDDLEGGP